QRPWPNKPRPGSFLFCRQQRGQAGDVPTAMTFRRPDEVSDGDALKCSRDRHLRLLKGWEGNALLDRRDKAALHDALHWAHATQDIIHRDDVGRTGKLIASPLAPFAS